MLSVIGLLPRDDLTVKPTAMPMSNRKQLLGSIRPVCGTVDGRSAWRVARDAGILGLTRNFACMFFRESRPESVGEIP